MDDFDISIVLWAFFICNVGYLLYLLKKRSKKTDSPLKQEELVVEETAVDHSDPMAFSGETFTEASDEVEQKTSSDSQKNAWEEKIIRDDGPKKSRRMLKIDLNQYMLSDLDPSLKTDEQDHERDHQQ